MKKIWTWITKAFNSKPTVDEMPKTINATLTATPTERNCEPVIERFSKISLTEKQKWIYEYVESCGDRFVSPTEVAKKYGLEFKGKELESNFSSPILIFLVTQGLLEKNNKGHYKKK